MEVPVRGGERTVELKRFNGTVRGLGVPRLLPAVLLVHGGPGRTSDYLEPLAKRICKEAGRSCYLYDQLGRGLPNSVTLKHDAGDFEEIVRYLAEYLAEPAVHLIGHGFGGVILMEALLRRRLWDKCASSSSATLPRLSSVCLMGTPSSTGTLRSESVRLLRQAKASGGRNGAAASFWYRHYCSLRSVGCLTRAFAGEAEEHLGGWEPWDAWVIRGWEIRRSEVAARYASSTGGAPLLSVRGEHDFVTEACVEAWRGARDSFGAAAMGGGAGAAIGVAGGSPAVAAARGFAEEVVDGCGHNVHLEDPEAVGGLLHQWLAWSEAPVPSPA